MTVRSVLLLVLVPSAPLAAQGPADLVVHNATIHTADAARPLAQAMAVKDGRILFVGSAREALALAGPETERLDLGGGTVLPGLVDAHAHLMGLGAALRNVDLVGTTSYGEVVDRVTARATEVRPGEWILGRGWDQNDWGDTRFPTHAALSAAVPNHPVMLVRVDGHAALVNARAMAVAGVDRRTRDPSGGRLLRDAAGKPTGLLVDDAMRLVSAKIPPPSRDELRARALAAIAEANRWGLTGIHDAGVGPDSIAIFEELAGEGRFDLRNYVMISGTDSTLDRFLPRGPQSGLYGGRLWIRAIKLSADGALGSRGAAMIEPYADDPGNTGLVRVDRARVKAVAERALAAGFQLNVHAIGDHANRYVLDAFEAALAERPTADHRFRVEHAQTLQPDDIPRFARLGVIPSMQGSHQSSDMYWAETRLGYTRALGAYAWRGLLDTGVIIPNGSDFPVEHVNPLISFHAFVTRTDAAGWPAGGWFPAQRTTRQEALLSMTLWPAQAAFMERETGSLTPGKHADFVVLDQDVMTVPAERILATRVLRTVLGGKSVYVRE